jgi:predicted membrane protein
MARNLRLFVCDVYPTAFFFRFFSIISNNFLSVVFNKCFLMKIKKIIGILLAVCFVMSVTAASANANPIKNIHIYQLGYNVGAKAGYKVGFDAGSQDCIKYRQKGATTKIPNPVNKACWSQDYRIGYNIGFKNSFIAGYNNGRYGCLK